MKAHEFQYEMQQTAAVFGRQKATKVVFSGDGAYTDGEMINLPSLPHQATLEEEEVKIMRGYVDHEAGHLRHSDMPLLIDFYKKAIDSGMETLKNIHNCLEDIWMEDRVMAEYPGAEKNLRTLSNSVKKKEIEYLSELPPDALKETNATSVMLGITTVGRDHFANEDSQTLKDTLSPKMVEMAKEWTDLARQAKNSEEIIDLAKAVYKYIQEDPSMSKDFDPSDNGLPMEGKGQEQDKKSSATQPAEGIPSEATDFGEIVKDLIENITKDKVQDGDHFEQYRVFSTKEDTVDTIRNSSWYRFQEAFSSGSLVSYENQKSDLQSHVNVMKSRIKRSLLALERRDWNAAQEQGRLDSKRLVAAVNGSPFVHKTRTDRAEINTAVSILVDLSGSMHGEKNEVAAKVAIALSECFEGTGIVWSVSGWSNPFSYSKKFDGESSSYYHRACDLNIVKLKDFDERLHAAKPALSALKEMAIGDNSDYDAILWQWQQLKTRREMKKVLFVLSDGAPYYKGHNVGRNSQCSHVKKIVDEVEKSGIRCVGIGIQDSSVEQFYKNHVVVDSLEDLAGEAFNKLNQILLGGKVRI